MSSPFVGEIRMFGGNFAPAGWAFCDGSYLAISENDALFALIGTTYGGDGQTTFALPDLRSRVPIHQGQGPGLNSYTIGQAAGVESITLTANQIPLHSHALNGSTASATALSPAGAVVASPTNMDLYRPAATPDQPMAANSLLSAGGSQPHDNLQPYLCISFIISLFGIFPTSN